jgi:hypothetical protein
MQMQLRKWGLVALLGVVMAGPALADGRWRGDIRHFDRHDRHHWQSGSWVHSHHDGRLGWWWVVGGLWYFYANPVYPYPDPYRPPVVIQAAPPVVVQDNPPVVVAPQPPQVPPANSAPAPGYQSSPYWYYCAPSQTYYPYVASCAAPWQQVPATPAGAPQ